MSLRRIILGVTGGLKHVIVYFYASMTQTLMERRKLLRSITESVENAAFFNATYVEMVRLRRALSTFMSC